MQKPGNDWAQSGVRHAKSHSAAFRDEAVRTSGAEGPLGVGLVLQSEPQTGLCLACFQRSPHAPPARSIWTLCDKVPSVISSLCKIYHKPEAPDSML